jgi:hypothetical protein
MAIKTTDYQEVKVVDRRGKLRTLKLFAPCHKQAVLQAIKIPRFKLHLMNKMLKKHEFIISVIALDYHYNYEPQIEIETLIEEGNKAFFVAYWVFYDKTGRLEEKDLKGVIRHFMLNKIIQQYELDNRKN